MGKESAGANNQQQLKKNCSYGTLINNTPHGDKGSEHAQDASEIAASGMHNTKDQDANAKDKTSNGRIPISINKVGLISDVSFE